MNDLLKVLDMSEDEQGQAILHLLDDETFDWYVDNDMHLADLAFRLRNEVCKAIGGCEKYNAALEAIYDYKDIKKLCQSFYAFQTYQIKPIDMIIAALKVKGIEE